MRVRMRGCIHQNLILVNIGGNSRCIRSKVSDLAAIGFPNGSMMLVETAPGLQQRSTSFRSRILSELRCNCFAKP